MNKINYWLKLYFCYLSFAIVGGVLLVPGLGFSEICNSPPSEAIKKEVSLLQEHYFSSGSLHGPSAYNEQILVCNRKLGFGVSRICFSEHASYGRG